VEEEICLLSLAEIPRARLFLSAPDKELLLVLDVRNFERLDGGFNRRLFIGRGHDSEVLTLRPQPEDFPLNHSFTHGPDIGD
jgi:hypothetical protein